jgi:hypothetical protein
MEERIKKSLLNITETNIKVSENPKSIEKKKKERFINLITHLKNMNIRTKELHNKFGINLLYYEDEHYRVIEELLIELYSENACKIIFWWVYDVEDPKKKEYSINDEKTEKKYTIKTPTQLYNILKKLQMI